MRLGKGLLLHVALVAGGAAGADLGEDDVGGLRVAEEGDECALARLGADGLAELDDLGERRGVHGAERRGPDLRAAGDSPSQGKRMRSLSATLGDLFKKRRSSVRTEDALAETILWPAVAYRA